MQYGFSKARPSGVEVTKGRLFIQEGIRAEKGRTSMT